MKQIALAAIVAGLLTAAPAQATIFTFTLTGPQAISFELDSSVAPTFYFTSPSPEGFYYASQTIQLDGSPFNVASISFGDATAYRQMQITSYSLSAVVSFTGPALFSGPGSAPVFLPGTYSMADTASGQNYSVTISSGAVPEPASWALMIGGFALAGGAMRARRKSVAFA